MKELVAKCFHRYYFRWQLYCGECALLWPAYAAARPGAADGAGWKRRRGGQPAVPRPLAVADVLRRKGLRSDAPHFRGIGREESGDRLTGGAEAAE